MASIKTEKKASKRAMLNTTIRTEILDGFKAYCKECGYPMNMILESFMEQFTNGEFKLKIGKANRIEVDIDDNIKEENINE